MPSDITDYYSAMNSLTLGSGYCYFEGVREAASHSDSLKLHYFPLPCTTLTTFEATLSCSTP